jgi:hypothetical protein
MQHRLAKLPGYLGGNPEELLIAVLTSKAILPSVIAVLYTMLTLP